jgi:hypothetical protein
LCFLLKRICENHPVTNVEKAKESECISADIHSYFPNIVCIHKFLEIVRRNGIGFPHQFQDPGDFGYLLVGECIQMLLHRALSRSCLVKDNSLHTDNVNVSVNSVNHLFQDFHRKRVLATYRPHSRFARVASNNVPSSVLQSYRISSTRAARLSDDVVTFSRSKCLFITKSWPFGMHSLTTTIFHLGAEITSETKK